MFRSKAALYDRLIEELRTEKDMHIRILVAEIDWLRAQLGRPSLRAAINPSELPEVTHEIGAQGWVSEADEAQAILDEHGLSGIHLPEILEGLGYGTSDLS